MSGFLITLSGLLVSSVFGLMMPSFGYDTLLDVQPVTVDLGFRLYPLHGRDLQEIKKTLQQKRDMVNNG